MTHTTITFYCVLSVSGRILFFFCCCLLIWNKFKAPNWHRSWHMLDFIFLVYFFLISHFTGVISTWRRLDYQMSTFQFQFQNVCFFLFFLFFIRAATFEDLIVIQKKPKAFLTNYLSFKWMRLSWIMWSEIKEIKT